MKTSSPRRVVAASQPTLLADHCGSTLVQAARSGWRTWRFDGENLLRPVQAVRI
jgi:hypothetical protein